MQAHALRRGTVDWPRVRAEALARAAHAETTVDTYDAIRFALASLGDHHCSLHLTPSLENLELERKAWEPEARGPGAQPGSFTAFVGRYEPEGRLETLGGRTFALMVVTKCFPENDREFIAYETKLQRLVSDLDRSHPAGWVVDLRGHVGGNMWPMLTGIGPVLGEGDDLGEFFATDGHSVLRYRDGIATDIANGKESPYPPVEGTPYKVAGAPMWRYSLTAALAVREKRWPLRFAAARIRGFSVSIPRGFRRSIRPSRFLTALPYGSP
jgi:hypothetical protein